EAPPQLPLRADADRCAEPVAGAITCNHQRWIRELFTAEKCGSCVTGMMIDEPDRICSKAHPENFRQTLAPAPLLVELKHWCLAKRSFQSRRVGACSLELREYPLPIAIGWLIYPRQRYDIHIGWSQSGVLQHELDALVREARMIFFSRRSLFL